MWLFYSSKIVTVYYLFVPTNAHTHTHARARVCCVCVYIYIYIYIYITNAPTCLGASASSSGTFDIAFVKSYRHTKTELNVFLTVHHELTVH